MNVQQNQSPSFGTVNVAVAKGVCPKRATVGENIARSLRQKSSGTVDYTVKVNPNSLSIGNDFVIIGKDAKNMGFVQREFNKMFLA